eukprot:CAMPEP_0194545158 /NCGR_PEP_ID=MMETSP0253-20130528/88729_1 /TAXON_ID=2966 /ORGANISM="Noctiluca scintillans" /LENGTH=107 /DNA_ID=CAMNT_0039392133 /DNA_START=135 /DNA_END=458 /DNA_ORIENTATION=-
MTKFAGHRNRKFRWRNVNSHASFLRDELIGSCLLFTVTHEIGSILLYGWMSVKVSDLSDPQHKREVDSCVSCMKIMRNQQETVGGDVFPSCTSDWIERSWDEGTFMQ